MKKKGCGWIFCACFTTKMITGFVAGLSKKSQLRSILRQKNSKINRKRDFKRAQKKNLDVEFITYQEVEEKMVSRLY